jgi:adenylosuccinate synthase
MVALKYSVMINGINELAISKLDVLDDFEEIKICTNYKIGGKILKSFPVDLKAFEELECEYITLPGWNTSLKGIRKYDDLPENTKKIS